MNYDLDKLKSIELKMLLKVRDICEKHCLEYFLVGGTLLGAVRHQGFIPWDDDIDIGMPRSDFEKFICIAQDELPKEIFVQSRLSEPQIPFVFAKLRYSNSTFIETTIKELKINHGVFIDIFPFDYYPTNSLERKLFNIKKRIIQLRINKEFKIDNKLKKDRRKIFIREILFWGTKLFYSKYEAAISALNDLYMSTPKSELWGALSGAWGMKEIVPCKWFKEYVNVTFEGYTFKAPKDWDKYLTHVYGDYMTLPPVEKQVAHHYTDIIDLDNSYLLYVK